MTEPIVTMKVNYPGNSEKSKAEVEPEVAKEEVDTRKKSEQITTGTVIQRKKSLGRKFKETFISGDDGGSVAEYVIHEVMVPAAKSMIADAFREGVERLLFGGGAGASRGGTSRYGGRPHTSYGSMYSGSGGNSYNAGASQKREEPSISERGRATHNFQEVVLATRPEAQEVLGLLIDRIQEYGEAQVDDLYSAIGITGTFQDTQWGWKDLGRGDIRRVRQGYILVLPDPRPLN